MIIGKSLTALGGGGLKPEIRVTAKAGALLNLHYKDSSIILQSYQLEAEETQHTFVVSVSETAYVVDDVTNSASVEVLVDAVAVFNVDISYIYENFSDNDWQTIIEVCQNNVVPDSWNVGSQKTMTIDGKNYSVDIIGKNHDTYSYESGIAPLTFQIHECYSGLRAMNSSATNSGGWSSCAMRTTQLSGILALMPSEVQAAIKEVNKKTSAGSQSSTIKTTTDKLFLLSEVEVFGSVSGSKSGEGSQYDYYKEGNSKIKYYILNGSAVAWWLRSPSSNYSTMFCMVQTNGGRASSTASGTNGAAFAFCF